ncbi:MAG: hypothetical protein DMD64_05855 [Gemmatimonadetes bacterium]|nr:MAG: hypothetical protein DMD64_05855 [Gemmatimonadota bacterium]
MEPDVSFQIAAAADMLDAESADNGEVTILAVATALPTAATLYPRQWNMRAIGADAAWDAGYLGSPDVKVVILDTGIDYLHPELQGLVDLSLSRSFVPAEDSVVDRLYPGRDHVTDLFWHGTAMAATVASNAKRLAGVTQHVTLIAVKVADRFVVTTTSAGLAGIVYAADQGADVMNVSGGVGIDKSESPGLIAAYLRALNYAWRKWRGTTRSIRTTIAIAWACHVKRPTRSAHPRPAPSRRRASMGRGRMSTPRRSTPVTGARW